MSEYYNTPECKHIVDKLTKCMLERSVMKYFGACEELKAEHNKCCRKQYEIRRQANNEKSKTRTASKSSNENVLE